MKPTINDELLACLTQLSADISNIYELLEYIEPVQNRLITLIKDLEGVKRNDRHQSNKAKSYAYR